MDDIDGEFRDWLQEAPMEASWRLNSHDWLVPRSSSGGIPLRPVYCAPLETRIEISWFTAAVRTTNALQGLSA